MVLSSDINAGDISKENSLMAAHFDITRILKTYLNIAKSFHNKNGCYQIYWVDNPLKFLT